MSAINGKPPFNFTETTISKFQNHTSVKRTDETKQESIFYQFFILLHLFFLHTFSNYVFQNKFQAETDDLVPSEAIQATDRPSK